jgi:RHS repeat-associated protein
MTARGSSSYSYNAANQLTAATVAGPTTTSYAYDGDGLRLSSTTGATTTSYTWDTNQSVPQLIAESNGGSELRRYVWAGADGLMSVRTASSVFYVAHDAMGSVSALTSSTGATETLTLYEPYGAVHSQTNVDPNAPSIPLGFQSQYLDGTGSYHLGARQLDPTTGTFQSVDPIDQPSTGPLQSAYLYVGDQPTVLIDPSGLWGFSACYYICAGYDSTMGFGAGIGTPQVNFDAGHESASIAPPASASLMVYSNGYAQLNGGLGWANGGVSGGVTWGPNGVVGTASVCSPGVLSACLSGSQTLWSFDHGRSGYYGTSMGYEPLK